MLLVVTFCMGVANFALHKAVLASRHPMMRRAQGGLPRGAGRFTLLLEFAVMVAALAFASRDMGWALLAYAIYTAANIFAAWLILRRKL